MEKFVKTTLKANTYLNNTRLGISASDLGEAYPYIIAKAGEEIDIWIQYYSDGRIYYTAFRKHTDGEYYTYTHMRNAKGELIKNCGGMFASEDLKKRFK